MGRMLLLVTVLMTGLIGMTSFNISNSNVRMIKNSHTEYSRVQAKNLAQSGVDWAIRKIMNDTTWYGEKNFTVPTGKISVLVTNTSSRYPDGPDMNEYGKRIQSYGYADGQYVLVDVVVQMPAASGVPNFFKYALAAEQTLSLGGDIQVVDAGNSSWNADVHTNQDLEISGSSLVKGFGTYNGILDPRPNKPTRFFQPNSNPYNLQVARQVDKIDIPEFDPSDYIAAANRVTWGNLSISGSTTLGSKEAPLIWYVSGNLTIHGNFTGYGVFIVDGTITVSGNTTFNSLDPLGNNLGLYSGTRVVLGGNTNFVVQAQILSAGDITFQGNVELHGLATSRGSISLGGVPKVYYRPATESLCTPFWKGEKIKPMIVSYYQ